MQYTRDMWIEDLHLRVQVAHHYSHQCQVQVAKIHCHLTTQANKVMNLVCCLLMENVQGHPLQAYVQIYQPH